MKINANCCHYSGEYECLANNEVATLLTSTKVIVEGTRPHAPFNIRLVHVTETPKGLFRKNLNVEQ